MKEIILATGNKGKIGEMTAILSPIRCISQVELGITSPNETGQSFIENAILKARHASLLGKKAALADDSGLVVESLQGEPGIYSARYAGPHATDAENIALLLDNLSHVPKDNRQAYFYCAIAVVTHANDPTPLIATGKFSGRIIDTPKGNNGFGYDPIFFVETMHCTVAQLPAKIKNTISHRAQALNQLRHQLFNNHHD
ncbi:RdgB/HAM1 family non-canonical purine NTP pyrophosphatase [Legionella jamestowniensis]|uniref:dITP/XTP pyrophosphatase n=1 Tax=Legionella jamestowniensis TaxID=455 RepID=A0A0W0UK90_9GAMM|nr:RdgB/HAM1 family non-canonical purine NTP pyrophosphatase [Legionella jamestowniensis]KTD08307.1 dITP/XTP pyrophosphatase [Legionella jamestowniensis]OCH97166.1 non-canonical purine NTP pyrophosphatase, RdgB/HAM1 family [Legionella jamestowniensis]SFL49526.1 XTP/dITP diphosphohydrolase [Legionella jamestowniensis DSM 19215]